VIVIVPALNEQETVAAVIADIRRDLGADVLVVDDGSTDRTAEIARRSGASVVRHPFNLGVGAALRTGFRFAEAHGYQIAMQIDADGQHDPHEAARLLERVQAGSDIVVGSRFASGSGEYQVAFVRRTSMKLLSAVLSRRIGRPITDTTSGFRAFSRSAIELFATQYPSAYLSDTVESLLIAHYNGLSVEEVPVSMHERMGGVASNNWFRSAYHLVRLVLVITLSRSRRPLGKGH
jgi:glycosyltransferase involved in cell wall biosynthesis